MLFSSYGDHIPNDGTHGMFKKILVPLDRSRMAEAALPVARGLAQSFGAETRKRYSGVRR